MEIDTMIGLVVGFIFGSTAGVIITCLAAASAIWKDGEDEYEKYER